MIKSLFYSDSVESYREYALNLEDKGIDYWTTGECGRLHNLMTQMKFDVVFVDYQMFEPGAFDVRAHVAKHNKKLIVLFFNRPEQKKELILEYWRDDATQFYIEQYTDELDDFLHVASGYKAKPESEYLPRPTKLRAALPAQDVETGQVARAEKDNVSVSPTAKVPVDEPCVEQQPERKAVEAHSGSMPAAVTPTYQMSSHVADGDNLVMKLFKLRTKYKISFSELVLLELFYKNQNNMVTVQQMMDALWNEQSDKHLNTLYSYIHSLRAFLAKSDTAVSLIRVKKGCYSLVSNVET